MSATLYIELTDKSQTDQAAQLLRTHPINMKLKKIGAQNVHIYDSKDLQWAHDENTDMIKWMEKNQGKYSLDINSISEEIEDAGYDEDSILQMQTEVFKTLNVEFKVEYYAASSAFNIDECYFSIEQMKSITNNGSLLSGLDEYRSLYVLLLEDETETVITQRVSTNKLLQEVRAANEDFEWYPTTNEIIEVVYWDMMKKDQFANYNGHGKYENTYRTVLDIGAGNGKLFSTIKDIADSQEDKSKLNITKAYAIEKSQTLINSLHEDVFVVGTDFYEQTLIDKQVDVVFSNPPYSEYSQWSTKVIKESNCNVIYLVIPDRWERDKAIANAIESRGAKVAVIGNYSFENSEDRKARAEVSLLKITIVEEEISLHRSNRHNKDPFDLWFDEVFSIDMDVSTNSDDIRSWEEAEKKRTRIKELVKGQNVIERLVELYDKELNHLVVNYKKIAELDGDILKELGVSIKGLKEAFKLKIEGVKNLYWKELFDNLDTITSRLTSSSRDSLLGTLTEHTNVDFTVSNAYAVVIWAIKNANKYYDSQLLELYFGLSRSENVRLYKSNTKFVKDGWRYSREKMTHYALDYRIVDHHYDAISSEYSAKRNMGPVSRTRINDIVTIASNLGFSIKDSEENIVWMPGKKNLFEMNEEEKIVPFMEVKAFLNGNLHFKFSPKFMKALNLEAARLNKWIKSPQEATEEFDITLEEATEMFGSNFVLQPSNLSNLLPSSVNEDTPEVNETEPVNNESYSSEQLEVFETGSLF